MAAARTGSNSVAAHRTAIETTFQRIHVFDVARFNDVVANTTGIYFGLGAAAISISGIRRLPVTSSTVEQLDLENIDIAVGILLLCDLEFEI